MRAYASARLHQCLFVFVLACIYFAVRLSTCADAGDWVQMNVFYEHVNVRN